MGRTAASPPAAKFSLAAAVVAVGVGAVLYFQPHRPRSGSSRRDPEGLDYVASAAEGHTLYTPEPWVKDLTTYPGFTTTVPEGGLTSYGYLDEKWQTISQFDADALTAIDKNVSATARTLCRLIGPAGTDASLKAASGDRVKILTVCLDVPGHHARVRVIVYLADGDAMVQLATTLFEDGRILNARPYEKDPAAVADPVADPTGWAGEVLTSLTTFAPARCKHRTRRGAAGRSCVLQSRVGPCRLPADEGASLPGCPPEPALVSFGAMPRMKCS